MKRKNHIRIGSVNAPYCKGVRWYCDSKNACYAVIGKDRHMYGRTLLRAECIPKKRCKAEVLVGAVMVGRKRAIRSMNEAKDWACRKARKG